MNSGTAIFLTALLLFGAFIGLGYLINHSINQAENINQLQQRVSQLQRELVVAQQTNQANQTRIQDLQSQINTLTKKLEEAQVAHREMVQSNNSTSPVAKFQLVGDGLVSGLGIPEPFVIALLVAATVVEACVIRHIRAVTITTGQRGKELTEAKKSLLVRQEVVDVKMSRGQLMEYINYKRLH